MMMGNGPPSSTLGALAYIARHEGVGALYNGIWLTWVRPPGQLLSMAGARQRRACAPASARVKRPAHAPRSRAHRGGHAGIQDRWFDDVAGGAGAAVGPDTAPQLRCLGECAQIKQAPQYAVTFLVYDLTKKALAVDNGAPPRARPAEPEPPTAAGGGGPRVEQRRRGAPLGTLAGPAERVRRRQAWSRPVCARGGGA